VVHPRVVAVVVDELGDGQGAMAPYMGARRSTACAGRGPGCTSGGSAVHHRHGSTVLYGPVHGGPQKHSLCWKGPWLQLGRICGTPQA